MSEIMVVSISETKEVVTKKKETISFPVFFKKTFGNDVEIVRLLEDGSYMEVAFVTSFAAQKCYYQFSKNKANYSKDKTENIEKFIEQLYKCRYTLDKDAEEHFYKLIEEVKKGLAEVDL